MTRTASITRTTSETDITVALDLDGSGKADIATGIGFLDHMLTALARHSLIDMTIRAKGDLHIDFHHTTEDVGIVIGQALAHAIGDKRGVRRFGHAVIPMDEALSEVTIDVCGRPTLSWNPKFPQPSAGTFDFSLLREFFSGLSSQARISLHVDLLRGENSHHMVEAAFKALGKALKKAYLADSQEMSSKGRIG
jgi:imidazoleglycerol-phosphate dehydratase